MASYINRQPIALPPRKPWFPQSPKPAPAPTGATTNKEVKS